MATPFPPQYMADTAVLKTVSINYSPTWDGANWVLTPSEIPVTITGIAGTNGVELVTLGTSMMAIDLPSAGQQALQDLYIYLEKKLADANTV